MSRTLETSAANFADDVLNATQPVLVDYWATWCGPCKMIAPILEDVAAQYGDALRVCKLDVDAHADIARKFGVRGVPTLMLLVDGEVRGVKTGAMSKSQMSAWLESCLP